MKVFVVVLMVLFVVVLVVFMVVFVMVVGGGGVSHGASYWPKGWMRVDSRRFGCWSNTREQSSRESDARV